MKILEMNAPFINEYKDLSCQNIRDLKITSTCFRNFEGACSNTVLKIHGCHKKSKSVMIFIIVLNKNFQQENSNLHSPHTTPITHTIQSFDMSSRKQHWSH